MSEEKYSEVEWAANEINVLTHKTSDGVKSVSFICSGSESRVVAKGMALIEVVAYLELAKKAVIESLSCHKDSKKVN